jgi:glucan phosphorylase
MQAIDAHGYQQELPDIWLTNGNPWEIARSDITYRVGFYGTVDNFKWSPAEQARVLPCCCQRRGSCTSNASGRLVSCDKQQLDGRRRRRVCLHTCHWPS